MTKFPASRLPRAPPPLNLYSPTFIFSRHFSPRNPRLLSALYNARRLTNRLPHALAAPSPAPVPAKKLKFVPRLALPCFLYSSVAPISIHDHAVLPFFFFPSTSFAYKTRNRIESNRISSHLDEFVKNLAKRTTPRSIRRSPQSVKQSRRNIRNNEGR